jgi:hypothetical protein
VKGYEFRIEDVRPDQADAERKESVTPSSKSNKKGRQVERRNEVFAFVFGFQPLKNIIQGTQGQQPKVFEENYIVSISSEPTCLPSHAPN